LFKNCLNSRWRRPKQTHASRENEANDRLSDASDAVLLSLEKICAPERGKMSEKIFYAHARVTGVTQLQE
jgi:hypothetical protein